jgi:acyl-CoA thioesterase I
MICKFLKVDNPNIEVSSDTLAINAVKSDKKNLVFFGNSLTAGFGLNESASFPSLIRNIVDSLGLPYNVVNAGLSGDTSADGLGRIDWILKQRIDVFVLELGANDALRGLDVKLIEKNLSQIIDKVKLKNADCKFVIAGMKSPPNMGKEFIKIFDGTYPSLAKKYNAKLIPFLLQDVAGIAALNLPDGKHPNEIGQKIVTKNVWKILEQVL